MGFRRGRKFQAKWTRDIRGVNHPSDGEAKYFNRIYAREERGEISGLEPHPTFPIKMALNCPYCAEHGEHVTDIELDTSYIENGVRIFEDYKGIEGDTPLSRLKVTIMRVARGIHVRWTGPAQAKKMRKAREAEDRRAIRKRERALKKLRDNPPLI